LDLRTALRLAPGTVVSFVGAGGKTRSIRRLTRELAGEQPVLVTTTTHLAAGEASLAASHVIWRPGETLEAGLQAALAQGSALVSGGPLADDPGKLAGVPIEVIDAAKPQLAEHGVLLLVEADGSRQRPLKAPAEHEPVIPGSTDLAVPVVGLWALGERLSSQAIHRPERVAAVTGLAPDGILEPEHVVRLLTSPSGALKGVPAAAAVRPLLATEGGRLKAAREIAQGALEAERIASVIVAAPNEDGPCLAYSRVGAVILAAGNASRMGSLKQAEAWRGQALVERAVAAAAGLEPIVVVLGAEAERVRRQVARGGVQFVVNERWQEGQSGSMRVGLAAVAARCEAVVFLLADMPLVDGELIGRLVEAHRASLAPIVAPQAGGRWGNPVLFDRVTFEALAQVRGDRGGRAIFEQFPIMGVPADERSLLDVDTAEDWQALG